MKSIFSKVTIATVLAACFSLNVQASDRVLTADTSKMSKMDHKMDKKMDKMKKKGKMKMAKDTTKM